MSDIKPILVIDDQIEWRNTLSDSLKRAGYRVIAVESVEEARKEFEKGRFSMVVLDLYLPEEQPWQNNVKKLKNLDGDLKILAISSDANLKKTLAGEFIRAGVWGFHQKPDTKGAHQSFISGKEGISAILADIDKALKPYPIEISTRFLLEKILENSDKELEISLETSDKREFQKLLSLLCEEFIQDREKHNARGEDQDEVIVSLIKNTKIIDWISYITDKRYRNHFEHQFNVGALGWWLMGVNVLPNCSFRDYCVRATGIEEKKIDRAWWIAALLHDHAYPISHLLKTFYARNFLFGTDFSIVSSHIGRINEAFERLHNDMWSYDLRKVLGAFKEDDLSTLAKKKLIGLNIFSGSEIDLIDKNVYDHGLLSALNLATWITGTVSEEVKLALRAIFVHNNPSIKVEMEKDPIAFLLVLCDSIQEWGRELIVNNKPIVELDRIVLELNKWEDTNGEQYQFPKTFPIHFDYHDSSNLKKTGWSYEMFIRSCEENLSRLVFPASQDFCPKSFQLDVKITTTIPNTGEQ